MRQSRYTQATPLLAKLYSRSKRQWGRSTGQYEGRPKAGKSVVRTKRPKKERLDGI